MVNKRNNYTNFVNFVIPTIIDSRIVAFSITNKAIKLIAVLCHPTLYILAQYKFNILDSLYMCIVYKLSFFNLDSLGDISPLENLTCPKNSILDQHFMHFKFKF